MLPPYALFYTMSDFSNCGPKSFYALLVNFATHAGILPNKRIDKDTHQNLYQLLPVQPGGLNSFDIDKKRTISSPPLKL